MKYLVIVLMTALLFSCASKPKVFYLNSYHEGYGSSDDITAGIQSVFADKNIELDIFYMDTKRRSQPEYIQEITSRAVAAIADFQPDAIIASDDNAVKYVIAPHFSRHEVPVIFCGVNWSCEQYNLPTANVTGMLEVFPLQTAFTTLKNIYPDLTNLAILSENTNSEQKNKELLDPIYRGNGFEPQYFLCNDFVQWKQSWQTANAEADLIFFLTNGAIKGWDDNAAQKLISSTIQTPVFTPDDFMMPYAVFGFTKVAQEQGEWAAQQVLDIFNGKDISEIKLTENQKAKTFLNKSLAEKINFTDFEKLGEYEIFQ